MESTHDRVAASRLVKLEYPEYIRREVAQMTSAEMIMIFIEINGLMISFGGFVIALLAFLDKRNKHK